VAQLEILSPGVYGFEKEPSRAPEGISPAKAGFVGWTDEGPSNTPVEVRSTVEFERVFGPISSLGLVPIGIQGFFGNGGQRAYIVRVVPSDAISAWADIDPTPGPTKWTFTMKGEGTWGNDTRIHIRGNRNFLDRTAGAEQWEKFDLLVLRPSEYDASILVSEETYEAVQFTDPDAADYVTTVLTDPRKPSQLVEITEGAGGTPSGLIPSYEEDEVLVAGGSVNGIDTNFSGTLAQGACLDNTLRIVAADAQVDDEAQTPTPAIDGIVTTFAITLPTTPVLDGSLRMFYAKVGDQVDNLGSGPFAVGTVNGIDTAFQIAAGALTAPVHRENTVFRIRYAVPAGGSPWVPIGAATPGQIYDLASTPIPGVTPSTPVHPGTLAIAVTTVDDGAQVILDDGAGNLINPLVFQGGTGTIDYTTGAMTGQTLGSLGGGLAGGSPVTVTYDESDIITKAAATDNMAQAVALAGAIGAGTNAIDLVDSVTAPTQSGLIDFTTSTPPQSGTNILVDYVPLGIVNGDVAGDLTELGGVAGAAGSADYVTGAVALTTLLAPRAATTIDADYQSGQVATDDGLGNLVGDVDAAGTNTIDYDTGAYDITWDSAPTAGTDILGNYTGLASDVEWQMSGGVNGSAVTRADISAAALESSKQGIYALDLVEEPLNVVVPDFEGSEFVQFDMVQFAKNRPDLRYLIMGYANGTTVSEAIKYIQVDQAWDEKIGAMYYPNVYFVNPLTDRVELVPITPLVAGVYARTANTKNVGKAPGGVEDGALNAVGVVAAEFVLEKSDRDNLYQSRINPIISSDATGIAVWGVRSLSRETRWRYINARTLHNFLMYATSLNLQWAVFENNGPPLWAKIETALKGYYGSLFRLGYFAGQNEDEAFFVTCNATNNNASTVAEGKAIIDIGFNPGTPAEFITFTLQQPVGTQTS